MKTFVTSLRRHVSRASSVNVQSHIVNVNNLLSCFSDGENCSSVGSLVQKIPKTLKSVPVWSVGSLKLRKSSYSAGIHSASGLARN